MKLISEWPRIASGLLLVVAAGCHQGPPTAPVSGAVTFDGKPLKFGSVMFQCDSGGQPARGAIAADGRFKLSTFREGDGAIVGKHRVRVVCYSTQDPEKFPNGSPGDSLGALLIPERYASLGASGLTAEVPPEGLADFKIELSSKGPGR